MKVTPMMIVVTLLLLSTCITATVSENCKIKNNMKCANGSTIALTVVLSLLVATTAPYWFKEIYFPTPAVPAALSSLPSM